MMQRCLEYLLLHGAVCLYSTHTIIAKFVSTKPFPSLDFLGLCIAEFAVLGLYAICWQKILHHFELSIAYMNKAAVLLWSLVWNHIFFHEAVTPSKLLGITVILCGILILNSPPQKTKGDL